MFPCNKFCSCILHQMKAMDRRFGCPNVMEVTIIQSGCNQCMNSSLMKSQNRFNLRKKTQLKEAAADHCVNLPVKTELNCPDQYCCPTISRWTKDNNLSFGLIKKKKLVKLYFYLVKTIKKGVPCIRIIAFYGEYICISSA